MNMFFTLFIFILSTLFYVHCSDSLSLPVEHSFDGGHSFKLFGSLNLRPSVGTLTLTTENSELTEHDKQSFLESAKHNRLYYIRIKLTGTDYLESSVAACQLLGSELKAKLIISTNDLGFPVSAHISTLRFDCVAGTTLLPISSMSVVRLSITLSTQKPDRGPSPETIKYLLRLEKQREEMARAEQGDNRSFFAKYWTYIVPAVILFIVFSSIQDASGAGAGEGSGGGH